MTETDAQGNEFAGDHAFDAHGLPETLRHLLHGRQIFLNPSPVDYREMSKEFEQANTAGLPLYPIRRPWPAGTVEPKPLAALAERFGEAMQRVLKTTAWVMTEFGHADLVRIVLPQAWGYLAQTLGRLSGREHPASLPQPARFTLLVYPPALTRRNGSPLLERGLFADSGEAVLIGSDDPGMLVGLIESKLGPSFFVSRPLPAAGLDSETALRPGTILYDVPLDDRARPIPFIPDAAGPPDRNTSGLVIPPPARP